jgi:hypothetical protein
MRLSEGRLADRCDFANVGEGLSLGIGGCAYVPPLSRIREVWGVERGRNWG